MGEKNKKIAVAGHISLDITPVFQNSGKQKLSELFQPGKLLKVGKAMMCTGGAVSNTGLGLKRLGADVVLMAKIGDDYFGNAPPPGFPAYRRGPDGHIQARKIFPPSSPLQGR